MPKVPHFPPNTGRNPMDSPEDNMPGWVIIVIVVFLFICLFEILPNMLSH